MAAEVTVIAPTVFTDDNTVNGNCTLREAIRAANLDTAVDACPAGSGADTIPLQAETYELTVEGAGEELSETGDLDVRTDLTINGAGATATIVDGAWPTISDRIFDIPTAGAGLVLTGLTVRDGSTNPSSSGGGISVAFDTTLALTDGIVTSNEAGFMGGINVLGTATLERVLVSSNMSLDCCGGIGVDGGTLVMTDAAVIGNSAPAGSDGGIWGGGMVTLNRVTIANNTALEANGGFSASGPSASLTNVTISGNRSGDSGGGIWLGNPIEMNNVTITNNVADDGGDGSGDGGGLYQHTVHPFTMRNTIIAGNTDGGGQAPDCSGSFTSAGHNLIGNTTGCMFTPGTGDLLNVDPKLAPLADNGGYSETHALMTGSPAIDAAGPDAEPVDQRGLPRNPDIGAYELMRCGKVAVTHMGTEANDTIVTGAGDDVVLTFGGNDTIKAQGGNDTICAGKGRDTVRAGSGKDLILGEGGNDKILAQGGRDRANGGGGKDLVKGGSGKDKLNGGAGKDKVKGQGGSDRLIGGGGNDFCHQGGGTGPARKCERGPAA